MFSQTNCEEFKSTLARLSFLMFPLQPGQKVGVFKSTTASGSANESTCMWDTNQLPAKRWLTVPFRGNDESSVFLQFCFWMLLVSFFGVVEHFLVACLCQPISSFWIMTQKRFSPHEQPVFLTIQVDQKQTVATDFVCWLWDRRYLIEEADEYISWLVQFFLPWSCLTFWLTLPTRLEDGINMSDRGEDNQDLCVSRCPLRVFVPRSCPIYFLNQFSWNLILNVRFNFG